MKNQLPKCPINDGEGEEAWTEGLEILLEELKFDEELPFKDPEEIWDEVGYILEEEELQLTELHKSALRKIFDGLWPQFKD
jgi:hypothetical protein